MMKRAIKKKIDAETINPIYMDQSPESSSPPAAVQPPLPVGPPPSSPPVVANLIPKKEIEDPEYNVVEAEIMQKPQEKKKICREFIRWQCNRPNCIYAHERDLTQLEGIFTFCIDYQNNCCHLPSCIYVHASVSEKEEFFRTGFMKKSILDRTKKVNAVPPLHPVRGEPKANIAVDFTKPPPVIPKVEKPLGMVNFAPVKVNKLMDDEFSLSSSFSSLTDRAASPPSENGDRALSRIAPSLRCYWQKDPSPMSGSPTSVDTEEPAAKKKCTNCDITKLRLQSVMEQATNMLRAGDSVRKKIERTNEKNQKLEKILNTFSKCKSPASPNINRLSPPKEKTLFEQLTGLLTTGARSPVLTEDARHNLTNLIAKYFLSSGASSLSPDMSLDNGPM